MYICVYIYIYIYIYRERERERLHVQQAPGQAGVTGDMLLRSFVLDSSELGVELVIAIHSYTYIYIYVYTYTDV